MLVMLSGEGKEWVQVCCMYMSVWVHVSVVRAVHLLSALSPSTLLCLRCLSKQEAHCLGWVGWPVSPQDPPIGSISLLPSVTGMSSLQPHSGISVDSSVLVAVGYACCVPFRLLVVSV